MRWSKIFVLSHNNPGYSRTPKRSFFKDWLFEDFIQLASDCLDYSQLSRKRPPLGHDKVVAYGKDQ